MPKALTEAEIADIVAAFAAAARRAAAAGFRVLEIHAAHGYLLHSFMSPLANKRNDRYGGVRAGRKLMYDPFWALHAAEALGADPDRKLWQSNYGWAMQRRAEIKDRNALRGSYASGGPSAYPSSS